MYLPQLLSLLLVLFLASCGRAQNVAERLQTGHGPLDEKLARLVTADELAISAQEAAELENAVFLDARETAEYAVSHLPDARLIGYNRPNFKMVKDLDKDRPLVVYCTVGYRSERLAKKLRKKGFIRVYNLYGSLYAWALAGFPLENAEGPTKRLHTYNKEWGKLYPGESDIKVYK